MVGFFYCHSHGKAAVIFFLFLPLSSANSRTLGSFFTPRMRCILSHISMGIDYIIILHRQSARVWRIMKQTISCNFCKGLRFLYSFLFLPFIKGRNKKNKKETTWKKVSTKLLYLLSFVFFHRILSQTFCPFRREPSLCDIGDVGLFSVFYFFFFFKKKKRPNKKH